MSGRHARALVLSLEALRLELRAFGVQTGLVLLGTRKQLASEDVKEGEEAIREMKVRADDLAVRAQKEVQ